MLKNIIFPEKIGSYYLFGHYRASFDIQKNKIFLTLVFLKGKKRAVKHIIEEPILQNESSYEHRVSQAIKSALKKVRYHSIVSVLPSFLVIFKQITLPFSNPEKIASVVPYEVEPLLPFSLENAVVDFIITKTTAQETTVLVAAVKKEYINAHKALFAQADVDLNKITIDVFELYGLYLEVPAYQTQEEVILLDIGLYTTRIISITQGVLQNSRMLNKGISTAYITKNDLEQLIRFGISEQSTTSEEARKNFETLLRDIEFTLTSFHSTNTAPLVLLSGEGAYIKGLSELLFAHTNYVCQMFEVKGIFHQKITIDPSITIFPDSFVSLATALSSPTTELFNLIHHTKQEDSLLNKQLFTIAGLTIAIFFTIFFHIFSQLNSLKNELRSSEQQTIKQLKNSFNVEGKNLTDLLENSTEEVEKEEKIWFSLSSQNRLSFLNYLEELSNLIDRQAIDLDLRKLSITRDTIVLEGSVKNYDSLDVLQRELRRSQLFKLETPLQDPNFRSIRLIINKHGEEA